MPNTAEGRQDQIADQSYIKRVGATSFAVIGNLPDVVSSHLTEVIEARDNWVESCAEASKAEEAFQSLMGHPSHVDTIEPEINAVGIRVTRLSSPANILRTQPEYDGYGRTQAAHRAANRELDLRRSCVEAIESVAADPAITDIQKAVMRGVLDYSYPSNPAQKNPISYAREAFGLVDDAQTMTDQPLVAVRRRWYAPMTISTSVSKESYSDLLTAEGFELRPKDETLQLVLKGVQRVVFEKLQGHHVGGMTGQIGSGHYEDRWDAVREIDMTVEELDELDIVDVMADDQIIAPINKSFPALNALVSGRLSDFDQLPEFMDATGLNGFELPSNEKRLFIVSGVDPRDLQAPDVALSGKHKFNNGFRTGLRDALGRLDNHRHPKPYPVSRHMRWLLRTDTEKTT